MLNLTKLSELRFDMSKVPEVGGAPGDYEEKLSQWLLEQSFFRDFVYRNPRGRRKGEELADAVVLFDDVALMVQVKARCGARSQLEWAAEALGKAFEQVCKTDANLKHGHVKKLKNEFHGEIEFKPEAYPNRMALLILAHESDPYIAEQLLPKITAAEFPTHVFSLVDFRKIAARFDTAGDMITFLELRSDVGKSQTLFVQDELKNIERMLPHCESVLRTYLPGTPEKTMEKTISSFKQTATGELMRSDDWRYGLAVDDMIARAHTFDPSLAWTQGGPATALEVGRFLGWLTRDRRIRLGKRIVSMCDAARDGNAHYFPHVHPSRKVASVFLSSSLGRAERVEYLEFLVAYAHVKYADRYGVRQCFGVATEPIGNGRSYDFIVTRSSPPKEFAEKLRFFEDPFLSDEPL